MEKELRSLDLIGLTSNNIEHFYTVKFNRWLFEKSDNVWVDGELISKNAKLAIQLASYNIETKPKSIKVDGLIEGFKLDENTFIENELYKNNKLVKEKYIIRDQYKIKDYISYLENKLNSLNKVEIKKTVSLKSQETFALYCHYANINPNDYKPNEISELLKGYGVKPGDENTKRPYHKLKQFYGNYLKTFDRVGAGKAKLSKEKLKRFNLIIKYCENNNRSDLLPLLKEDRAKLEQSILFNKE